jgi:hypothetical protein
MQRNMTILTSLLAVVAAMSGAIGCSSTSGPSGGGGSGSSSGGPVANPSFKTDIMPIFHQSCTISSSCHGQPNNSAEANLYLGNNFQEGDNTADTIMMTYAGLVGVKAVEDPAMALVTAKDPANSFLIHKLSDDQNTLNGLKCTGGTCPAPDCDMTNVCGIQMPKTAAMLDSATIGTVTNWIMQGAMMN